MTKARDLSNLVGSDGIIDNTKISLDANEVPSLDTAKITTGTFASARINNASLSAITALPSGVGGTAWQSVQTSAFTAVAGRGYPCNTTSSAFTVTLPASATAGDTIQLVDYSGAFNTNNLTVNPNGLKIQSQTGNKVFNTNRIALTFTYIDSTQGWSLTSGYLESTNPFYVAPYSVDFLVVGGGGSGGNFSSAGNVGGGGGAGGFRTSTQTVNGGVVITATVGAGGAGAGNNNGSSSSISGSGLTTITSAGGGTGGGDSGAGSGGSGGGGGTSQGGGSGNTPSTSPSQGNSGGSGFQTGPYYDGGGGGGAGGSGANASTNIGGNGGNGSSSSITGTSVTYAGGGGGAARNASGGTAYLGYGGTGGGGNGAGENPTDSDSRGGQAGTVNTGGGAGGAHSYGGVSKSGGSGIVILRLPTASYSGTITGSPTVTTDGSFTVIKFTGSGTYTS